MSDQTLGEQLVRTQEYTIDNRTAQGEITQIKDLEENISVSIRTLTNNETITLQMEKPELWTDDYNFVRLMKFCGYQSGGPSQLKGSEIPLIKSDDEWKPDYRHEFDPEFDRRSYFSGAIRAFFATLLAVMIPAAMLHFSASISLGSRVFTLVTFVLWFLLGLLVIGHAMSQDVERERSRLKSDLDAEKIESLSRGLSRSHTADHDDHE